MFFLYINCTFFFIYLIHYIDIIDNNNLINNLINNFKLLLSNIIWNIEKSYIILTDIFYKFYLNHKNSIDYEYIKDEIEYIKNNKIINNTINYKYKNLKNIINYELDYDFIIHIIHKTDDKKYIKILNSIDDIQRKYIKSNINFIYIDICLNNDENNKFILDNNYVLNLVGNKIFNKSFIKWFLFKYYNYKLNNQYYVINTIDNSINLNKCVNNNNLKEYLLIKENSICKKKFTLKENI